MSINVSIITLKVFAHFFKKKNIKIFNMLTIYSVCYSDLVNIKCYIEGKLSVGRLYRSGMVNSKSFVGKVFLRIKRKFKLN